MAGVLRSCGLAVLQSCGLAVLRSCGLAVLQFPIRFAMGLRLRQVADPHLLSEDLDIHCRILQFLMAYSHLSFIAEFYNS